VQGIAVGEALDVHQIAVVLRRGASGREPQQTARQGDQATLASLAVGLTRDGAEG
jgi:hypothetical protein